MGLRRKGLGACLVSASEPTQSERVAQLQAQRDELADILKELVGAIEASVHLTHRAPLIARAKAALQAVGK